MRGHYAFNTEKLELPSISQVQHRGSVDVPWFSQPTYPQRPPFSSDRLPELQLPQSYSSSAPYSAIPSRSNGVYPQQSASSGYSGTHTNIGLKTPSPSPTSLNGASQPNGLIEETTDHSGYSNSEQSVQQYATANGSYNNNMNQHQQYMDSSQSHIPGAQSYPAHAASAGSMPPYSHYPQQPSVMHPASNAYTQSPSGYAYPYNGVTSPHAGTSVTSSIGSQMNPNMQPLPRKHASLSS